MTSAEVQMGMFFSIDDANIVAYLTNRRHTKPPRITADQLRHFLAAAESTMRWTPEQGFFSADRNATEKFEADAARALAELNDRADAGNPLLPEDWLVRSLKPLKSRLSTYDLYAQTIPGGERGEELTTFARHAAYSTGHHALVLITVHESPGEPMEFLDPSPILSPLVEDLGARPGMLFWDTSGNSVYVPLDDAQFVLADLLTVFRSGSKAQIAEVLRAHRREFKPKRILHLSDLHLGKPEAAENQQTLLQQLQRAAPEVDRFVITGDLYDQPKREYSIHFQNFAFALRQFSSKPPIVVPGNHDQKIDGTFSSDLREVAKLDWEKLVVDDDMGAVFFCFDSSREQKWAKGSVTKEQKRDVANEYGARSLKDRTIDNYLRVALLHHHPYSFKADEKSLLNRALRLVGMSDEDFLSMEDGPQFVDWCARLNVPLILHGHKHIPRHVTKRFFLDDYRQQFVSAVGCGTSLGAEGKPLSYNLVTWDAKARRVGVQCFADPGDGGGFFDQKLAAFSA